MNGKNLFIIIIIIIFRLLTRVQKKLGPFAELTSHFPSF